MTIVPITLDKVEILQSLAIRTYTTAFGAKNKPGVLKKYYEYAFAKAHLEKELKVKDSFWYFAKKGQTILGYLKLNVGLHQTEFQEVDGLEIERIYIDTPYLRCGHGKKLVEFAINKARLLEKNYI